MTIRVLLNPYSNRWNASKRWPEAEKALRAAGVEFAVEASQRSGELEEMASKAVRDGCETIVVAGGDGSIGEVVNGLAKGWSPGSTFPVKLGILPLGSANDFVFGLGL